MWIVVRMMVLYVMIQMVMQRWWSSGMRCYNLYSIVMTVMTMWRVGSMGRDVVEMFDQVLVFVVLGTVWHVRAQLEYVREEWEHEKN